MVRVEDENSAPLCRGEKEWESEVRSASLKQGGGEEWKSLRVESQNLCKMIFKIVFI